MADRDTCNRVWAEIRLLYPVQSDRIQNDRPPEPRRGEDKRRSLLEVMVGFLAMVPTEVLLAAMARIRAKPTVYASDSIMALITQAIGDIAEDKIPGDEEFLIWARSCLQRANTERIASPSVLFADAIRAAGGWGDLSRMSASDSDKRLKQSLSILREERKKAREQAAANPSYAMVTPEFLLPESPPQVLLEDHSSEEITDEQRMENKERVSRLIASLRDKLGEE